MTRLGLAESVNAEVEPDSGWFGFESCGEIDEPGLKRRIKCIVQVEFLD